jgi:MtrB/PioB family decaheme-associated outer membrane protein
MSNNASTRIPKTRPTVLALALVAAFTPAWAADAPEVEGSATVGIGAVSGDRSDRALFDQYSGSPPGSTVRGFLGADYYRRNAETGASTSFRATDLLDNNRELGFRWTRPGDWKFSADYRELQRVDPFVPNTGTTGAGTTTPQVLPLLGGPGSGGDVDLKTKRTGLGLGFSKVLSSRWQFDVNLSSEKKEGSRLFGVGFSCPSVVAPGCAGTTTAAAGWAVLMLPEPIDSTHTQADARFTFGGEQLTLSVGYYGSFYRNEYGSLNPGVSGNLYNPTRTAMLPMSTGLQPILNNAVALAPDNQAHQFDVIAGYAFTPTTHGSAKLAYSEATQTQNFGGAGFTAAPAGVSDLGGKLTTTLAQVGLTSRPVARLSLNGNLRYEHRSDSTPLALYGVEGTSFYTNRHYPLTTTRGKLEAAYQFDGGWRALVGVTSNSTDRGDFTQSSAIAGVTALRQKNDETGVRAELRKRFSDSLSGAVGVESSKRTGSNWLRGTGLGVTEVPDPNSAAAQTVFATGVFPVNLADRRRDKVKVSADWQASEKLALQVVAETGQDRYDVPSAYGVHKSAMDQVNLDASYAINDNWNVNGFLSLGRQQLDQARPNSAYMAFDDKSTTLGAGFTGHVSSKIDVGGNLTWMDDRNVYAQTLVPTADLGSAALLAASGGLPDIVFRQMTLKLFGKYTIDKSSMVRLDLIHMRSRWNDWAWNSNGTPFMYSDGTTVNYKASQAVTFIGVSYTRRWP